MQEAACSIVVYRPCSEDVFTFILTPPPPLINVPLSEKRLYLNLREQHPKSGLWKPLCGNQSSCSLAFQLWLHRAKGHGSPQPSGRLEGCKKEQRNSDNQPSPSL